MTIYDLKAQEFNLRLAEELKKVPEFKAPEWVSFVKSGPSRERPIGEEDFWYIRSASILRQIYIRKIIGVNRLKIRYGSKKNRGMKPERFMKAGGKIIRTILKQSDEAGFSELLKNTEEVRVKKSGRRLTSKGKEFLEEISDSKTK